MPSFIVTRNCAAAFVAACLLAPASAQSISDKMNNWLFGKPAPETSNTPGTPEEPPCPNVEVREGATTLAIEVSFTTSTVLETRSGSTLRTACGSTT